jgi:SSS family solute:Na+ symporter
LSSNLSTIDNLLILFYFIVVLLIGLAVSRTQGNPKSQYFLAGRSLSWVIIGSSLFATSISSEHFVGLAGAGALYGIGVGYFEWLSAIILFALGWVFAPIFIRNDVYTVPQFFGKRFDNKSRVYITISSVFTYLFVRIGVAILAGGIVMNGVLGWDLVTSTIFIVIITGLYTVIGGLNSVVFTQLFQVVLIVLGSLLLTAFSLGEIGGFSGLSSKLPSDYLNFTKPFTDINLSWIAVFIAAPIIGIWYWCSDQYIVQRILGARGISDAKKGTLLASILKTFPIFLLIIPGLAAAVLYPSVRGDEVYATN